MPVWRMAASIPGAAPRTASDVAGAPRQHRCRRYEKLPEMRPLTVQRVELTTWRIEPGCEAQPPRFAGDQDDEVGEDRLGIHQLHRP